MMDPTALAAYVPDQTIPIVSGCFAFGTTLALSTLAQKLMGVSTATKIVPSVLGVVTVCLASLVSQRAALCGHEWRLNPNFYQNTHTRKRIFATSSSSYRRDSCWELGDYVKIPKQELRV
jgi:hypothetical protein